MPVIRSEGPPAYGPRPPREAQEPPCGAVGLGGPLDSADGPAPGPARP